MKKTLRSLLAVTMLLSMSAATFAQDEMKPLFVASLRGYQELIDDLDFVGKVSGNPDLGKGIEGLLQLVTQGQGIAGLDKSKPWGLAVSSDGLQFQILGFMPINDLEKFTELFAAVGSSAQKGDDGVYTVELQGQTLALKQSGDWTFLSLGAEFLGDLPKDPTALLDGLDKKYDLAVRLYVQNIPEIFRQLAIEQIKLGVEAGFSGEGMQIPGLDSLPGGGQLPGADALPKLTEDQQKLAAALAREQLDAIAESMNDTDRVTFGVSIDRESGKTVGDVDVVVVPGSKLAEEISKMPGGKSRFAGFKIADAAFSLNVNENLGPGDIASAKESLAAVQEQINDQVDGLPFGDDQIKSTLKDFVSQLFDIGNKTFESGRVDLGAALVGKGPHTLLAGGYISDSDAATKLFDKLVETVENEAGFYGIEKNVIEHKGVKFSRVLLPLLPGEQGEMLANIFGGEVELVIGIGDKSAYIALGTNGVDGLKKCIDDSENAQALQPVELSAALGPLVKIASQGQDADPNLTMIASSLSEGKDRVNLVVKPVDNGLNVHFEGEEGLLKVLGTVITSVGPGLPQF